VCQHSSSEEDLALADAVQVSIEIKCIDLPSFHGMSLCPKYEEVYSPQRQKHKCKKTYKKYSTSWKDNNSGQQNTIQYGKPIGL